MKQIFALLLVFFFTTSVFPQTIYKFDNTAKVLGCSKVLLQKISKDWQYELRIEIQIDSIPKFKELDLSRCSKFIKVYLNKFPVENSYIYEICDDEIFLDKKVSPPTKYEATNGKIMATKWNEFIISVTLKNIILKYNNTKKLNYHLSFFNELRIGWVGG